MSYLTRIQSIIQSKFQIKAIGSSVGAGGFAISSSCGVFNTTGSLQAITNFNLTLVTLGNPVIIYLVPDGTTNQSFVGGPGPATFILYRDGSNIGNCVLANTDYGPSVISFVDTPSAASHNYVMYLTSQSGSQNAQCQYVKMLAYELP